MKICTITCHDVYNHGASLQAYALMKYLINCGNEVEIIDYKPNYLNKHYNLLSIDNPKWEKNIITKSIYLTIKLPKRLLGRRRKVAFDTFTSKYLRLTKERYTSNEELKKNVPISDVYICGSDQIWNSLHQNGKDPAFYLDFVPEGKIKASYAASFATDTISEVIKPEIKKRIKRLDAVSVRERSGVEILKKLNINNSVNVVDPVFLLDKREWDKLGKEEFKDKYILIYDFDDSKLIREIALKLQKLKGYKIYSINPGRLGYADRYFKYVGPETFVALVKNANFVISNSFHAAVFSIIYEIDFAIVNRNEPINTRMRDLLEDLGLNDRLVDEKNNLDKLLDKIDYKDINGKLNKKIKFSKQFLNNVLIIKQLGEEVTYEKENIIRDRLLK
jgi:hypothetical protein